MDFFQAALFSAAFLSSLVAGFLFAFAVVAMPGIKELKDREFMRAFQVMDRVIQNNQPVFILVWVGSVAASLAAGSFGLAYLEGIELSLLLTAVIVYLAGVQLPTIAINIPLNNKIQSLDIGALRESECRMARDEFEGRWNRWNVIRTWLAGISAALFLILLFRL